MLDSLCRAVAEEGYESATPIQAAAIPEVIKGRDLLGCAQTGTGKTAAFALPILHRLAAGVPSAGQGIRALVLTPTRELALQIAESFKAYGRHVKIKTTVVFGGVGIEPQKHALRRGTDILVATPGRFLDLQGQGFIDLSRLAIFVLDEADRMLDMGFIHDVRRTIRMLPKNRQNLLFSATMPRDIQDLAISILKNPAKVAVTPVASTSERIKQLLYYVDRLNKRYLLLHILESRGVSRVLIFTKTKRNANRVAEFLTQSNIKAEAIHGNKSQSARQRALENFKRGVTRALVASDIAARGIDIDDISHVINYDVPNVAETYVHRIGRTGRVQAEGIALSFCDAEERAYIHDIEKLMRRTITVVTDHPYPASETRTPQGARKQSGNRPGSSRGRRR